MSNLPSFVSEHEIEEEKKRRQEEWERVRTAEQPKDVPDPEYDPRSLYERLKDQREKKQFEEDEAKKLKHMVRGLDSEEVGFLDFVDNMKAAEESKRRLEEKKLIEEIHKTMETETLHEPATSTTSVVSKKHLAKPKGPSKQAQLIASGIKRRSSDKLETKEITPEKRQKIDELEESLSSSMNNLPKATEIVGVRPSAMRQIGVLPGLSGYSPTSGSSDDSSDSSGSDNGCVMYTNPIQQLIQTQIKPSTESPSNIKRTVSGGNSSQIVG